MFAKKYGREAVSTRGMDDKDFVETGMEYQVTFVGSMLVPTPKGHGSSRTEATIAKVYTEKYKLFGLRRLILTISSESIKLLEHLGKEKKEVAEFQLSNVTYCNTSVDKKYDKAFTFIISEEQSMYRAYVFHCDSVIRAKEILKKFSEAFKLHQTKVESIRLRSFSAPESSKLNKSQQLETHLPVTILEEKQSQRSLSDTEANGNVSPDSAASETDFLSSILSRPTSDKFNNDNRPRSQTEVNNANNLLLSSFEFGDFMNSETDTIQEFDIRTPIDPGSVKPQKIQDEEDDFTKLAEKRTRSFSGEKRQPGSGEGLLLLGSGSPPSHPQTQLQISFEALMNLGTVNKPQPQSPQENENLLQF